MSSATDPLYLRRRRSHLNEQSLFPGIPLNDSVIVLTISLIIFGIFLGCCLSKIIKKYRRNNDYDGYKTVSSLDTQTETQTETENVAVVQSDEIQQQTTITYQTDCN